MTNKTPSDRYASTHLPGLRPWAMGAGPAVEFLLFSTNPGVEPCCLALIVIHKLGPAGVLCMRKAVGTKYKIVGPTTRQKGCTVVGPTDLLMLCLFKQQYFRD